MLVCCCARWLGLKNIFLTFSDTLVLTDKVKHPQFPKDNLDADVYVKQTENRNVDTAAKKHLLVG